MERRVNDEIVNIAPTDTNDPSNKSWQETFKLVNELLFLEPYASNVVNLCDRIDATAEGSKERFLLRLSRQWLLTQILIRSRDEYISLVTLLIKRIPRSELPNLQDIPYDLSSKIVKPIYETNNDFVPDCELPTIKYQDSILDDILLKIFRVMVREEINYESTTKGIRGLLEEGKHFMLSEQGTPENQHAFVKRVLAGLLTPFLPPFYRIFMSGIIPCKENNDPDWLVNLSNSFIDIFPESIKKDLKSGKQLGPWFYAPALTSFVTPPFMSFLLGPSRPNRRKDGKLGGMVVEKCKFLQESGCKGRFINHTKVIVGFFFKFLVMPFPLTFSTTIFSTLYYYRSLSSSMQNSSAAVLQ
jgi:hypothetical protein